MIQLDYRDPRPVYEQVKEKIKELIVAKVLRAEDRIFSVREMSSYLTINPNTILKAYKELENEGYIYSIRGKGYFVSSVNNYAKEKRAEELKTQLEKSISELKCLGIKKENIYEITNKIFKEDAE